MATFGSNTGNTGTNNTSGGYNKTQQADSDREFITCFSERNGKYGTFYKAIIDGFEYYLTPAQKPDKNGHNQLVLKKCKTPAQDNR